MTPSGAPLIGEPTILFRREYDFDSQRGLVSSSILDNRGSLNETRAGLLKMSTTMQKAPEDE